MAGFGFELFLMIPCDALGMELQKQPSHAGLRVFPQQISPSA